MRAVYAGLIFGMLLVPTGARAGIYCVSDDLPPPFRIPPDQYLQVINELKSCKDLPPGAPERKESAPRLKLLKNLDLLKKRDREGLLSTRDLIEMTGILLRLGRDTEVAELLNKKAIPATDPSRFLLLAHQAVAWQGIDLSRAVDFQEQALNAWPPVWVGWAADALSWYRRAEQLHLQLLKGRLRESPSGMPITNWKNVDSLFPGVQFLGANGEYQAGEIAPRYFDKLSAEAPWLVLQLWLWNPEDDRLAWLMAEMLNAYGNVEGNIEEANRLFQTLGQQNGLNNRPELRQHRQIVKAAVEMLREMRRPDTQFRTRAFWMLFPPLDPFAGGAAMAVNWTGPTAAILAEKFPLPAPPAPQEPGVPPPFQLQWKQIFVSFVGGWIVCILINLQIREWRRRRPAFSQSEAEPEVAGVPDNTGIRR